MGADMPRRPDPAATTRWLVVSVMIASGVAASLHVGKVPPALPALRDELGLGLVAGGWVASIFNLIGATLGIASGLAADRLGARRVLCAGLMFLIAGSIWGATTDSGIALLATRVLAGLGLVIVAVAAPGIIVAVAPPRDHGLALGAWSIYMPAGMAVAMLSAPFVLPAFGWRGLWLVHAGLTAMVFVIVLATTRGVSGRAISPRRINADALRRPGPWLLAAAFGCYTVQFFAVTTWMPTFLVESYGSTREAAALAGALVVAANIAGCLAGAWLLHRDVARWKLLAITYLIMTPCAARGLFRSASTRTHRDACRDIQRGRRPAACRHPRRDRRPRTDPRPRRHRQRIRGAGLSRRCRRRAAGVRDVRRRVRKLGARLDADGGAGNCGTRRDRGDPGGGAGPAGSRNRASGG